MVFRETRNGISYLVWKVLPLELKIRITLTGISIDSKSPACLHERKQKLKGPDENCETARNNLNV